MRKSGIPVGDKLPTRRKLSFKSTEKVLDAPSPGSVGDPTIHGARLDIVNPTTGENTVIPLPAANWAAVGDPVGSKGYLYKDSHRTAGPCTKVFLRGDKRMRVLCKGDGIGFSLDEAMQGSLAVTLKADALPYCVLFGGEVQRDEPGVFRAKDSPKPSFCEMVPSPSPAFLQRTSGVLD